MTPAAARQAALHALTIIDAVDNMNPCHQGGQAQGRKDRAFTDLAAALDALFGPLPAEPVTPRREELKPRPPRQSLCGTVGGYRAHLTHGTFPCRACRLVGDE